MKTFKEVFSGQLDESSLGRILTHFNNIEIPVAIISGFRKEFTLKDNLNRNKQLAQIVKGHGYGYFFVEGHWIEDKGEPTEKKVKEDAVFVVGNKNDSGNLKGLIRKLVKDFNQDAAVFRPVGDKQIHLIFKDGSESEIGTYHPGRVGDYMTKLKHRGDNATFVVESTRDDPGFFGSYAKHIMEKHHVGNKQTGRGNS